MQHYCSSIDRTTFLANNASIIVAVTISKIFFSVLWTKYFLPSSHPQIFVGMVWRAGITSLFTEMSVGVRVCLNPGLEAEGSEARGDNARWN